MRALFPGIEKFIVSPGRVREGANFIGNSDIRAMPTNANDKKATMTVKGDMSFFLFINQFMIYDYGI